MQNLQVKSKTLLFEYPQAPCIQVIQNTLLPSHTVHHLTNQPSHPRYKKKQKFNNQNNYTTTVPTNSNDNYQNQPQNNAHLFSSNYIQSTHNNPPLIKPIEITLDYPKAAHAHLRTNNLPFLFRNLKNVSPTTHPSSSCLFCSHKCYDSNHLFNCHVMPSPFKRILMRQKCKISMKEYARQLILRIGVRDNILVKNDSKIDFQSSFFIQVFC